MCKQPSLAGSELKSDMHQKEVDNYKKDSFVNFPALPALAKNQGHAVHMQAWNLLSALGSGWLWGAVEGARVACTLPGAGADASLPITEGAEAFADVTTDDGCGTPVSMNAAVDAFNMGGGSGEGAANDAGSNTGGWSRFSRLPWIAETVGATELSETSCAAADNTIRVIRTWISPSYVT